jgi:hypothetical protein
MNDEAYADAELERAIRAQFGVDIDIWEMLLRHVPAGPALWATVFRAGESDIYVYLDGTITMTLGDVKKVLRHMGLKPDKFLPPRGELEYFLSHATERYKNMFPGVRILPPSSAEYYKSLVPYSPALVLVQEVVDGRIKQYDRDSAGDWRPAINFVMKKVRVKGA